MMNRPSVEQYRDLTNEQLVEYERKLTINLNDAADKSDVSRWEWVLDCLTCIELEKCRRQPRQSSNIAALVAREIGGAL